ncbi:hypothetical protein [Frigoriflavimonas asaccharolytica]|uniref:Uncharacterized protein n=1 Tax=Frigoriflavimonas asaccharolytica TaxID=2735899 RepID=A0A8J8G9Q1_9FLAO|nr:hypothetical protein [Frigoriflavimonas asaccharolytica]NRS93728.1 hypothetical protein [Frigoriflavimonas asaccharolytica]
MNITIEIENKEDFPFIKKLIENLKGVKILEKNIETVEDVEMPDEFFDALSDYADSLKDEDCISHDEFLKFIKEERCKLSTVK